MKNRRTFIKKSSLFLAATVLPYSGIYSFGPTKKLGVALLGLGNYATNQLAPALQETQHIELRGIVTGSPNKIPTWKRKYGIKDANVYSYENMDSLADNNDIDVVYIVTPTFLHSKYAVMAANTGKHVFCEKPMAMTTAECQDIIDACNQNKVKLAIGYRMQHEKNTKQIIEWAKTKPYGPIQTIDTAAGFRIGNQGGWRLDGAKGGGAIYDMGVYPLNAARYSTGLEPLSVIARHENKRPELFQNGANEITYFDLEFPQGMKADCLVTYNKGYNHLKIKCTSGGYELSPFQSYTSVNGTTRDGRILSPCNCNQQAIQMDNDALSIINNEPMLVPGEEGKRDIRIVEAIFESAKNGSKKMQL
ncbi:glucose-fructose oxidoreductase [Gillisia sp. Hel_I_86]|uniref:Gfo/Idh/MocA family protein n=1 Tax=Gillisia sp. Hel_I_86 TaxID=1249981 RepID=UPI00119B4A4F|nr:Gfo/Idh/MocA family oxidoreductase [Gillisia sp. Hel_I_86]TVZ28650.1 glucose-fructose oxidoreductase [Gillisia sp. Hel_I_86]